MQDLRIGANWAEGGDETGASEDEAIDENWESRVWWNGENSFWVENSEWVKFLVLFLWKRDGFLTCSSFFFISLYSNSFICKKYVLLINVIFFSNIWQEYYDFLFFWHIIMIFILIYILICIYFYFFEEICIYLFMLKHIF